MKNISAKQQLIRVQFAEEFLMKTMNNLMREFHFQS